jgi:hypothetical protein
MDKAEDSKLKDAVQTHNTKNLDAIVALVRLERKISVRNDSNVNRANRSKVSWTEDEDSKLKDAVQTHGGKNWGAVAAIVPSSERKSSVITDGIVSRIPASIVWMCRRTGT